MNETAGILNVGKWRTEPANRMVAIGFDLMNPLRPVGATG